MNTDMTVSSKFQTVKEANKSQNLSFEVDVVFNWLKEIPWLLNNKAYKRYVLVWSFLFERVFEVDKYVKVNLDLLFCKLCLIISRLPILWNLLNQNTFEIWLAVAKFYYGQEYC